MACLWFFLVACATICTPTYCDDSCSRNSLGSVVVQLSRCHERTDVLVKNLGPYLHRLAVATIETINVDRDRTLTSIQNKYIHTSIADEEISTLVVQASQMAVQFGDRKRTQAFACVVKVRQAVLQTLDEVEGLCGSSGDRATLAVLENVHNRVLRNLNLAIEWIRDYTETNIAALAKGVLESGKVALQLHDRVLTTDACRQSILQQQMAANIIATVKKIVSIFTQNDSKIYTSLWDFSNYFRQAEEPRQAVNDYLNDSKTGIVKTKI